MEIEKFRIIILAIGILCLSFTELSFWRETLLIIGVILISCSVTIALK